MASSVSSDNDDDYDSDVTCGSSDTDDKDRDTTDSGHSSNDDQAGTGDDDESDDESDDDDDDDRRSGEKWENVVWCGPKKNIPVLIFRPECNFVKVKRLYATGEKNHLAYKIVRTDCRVIRQLFHKHGFHEVHPNSSDFNLMWIGSHVKPYTLRSFTDFQKINHFPRSYEITRKDRLYKNFQRMQHAKGTRHFDFLPQTFCTPSEYDDLVAAHNKERGTWIVKPVASSRGRGIFLINNPQNVPLDAAYVVSRYLNNPLLIDGFKFDLRMYVAVTSYDPLRVYIFEEGLARFATVQYQHNNKTIRNTCMHLTNYSLNKKSRDYVKCDEPDIEDYGNKWSLGAMLRYLKKQGKDVKGLLTKIEDVINKTIICAELPVATACKMFVPYRGNCYELYGFDILIDSNLKPWVLEVNLSPSLACDAPLDLKIKSNLCGDLFSLTGVTVQDPVMRRVQQSKRNQELASSSTLRQQRQRPNSAGTINNKLSRPNSGRKTALPKDSSGLSVEERKIVLESKEEYARRGGWMRSFPSPNSMDKYGSFLESRTTHNQMLHSRLFSDRKLSHSLMHEMQERELEEHLAQLLRKLTTKDNSVERKNLRTRVRNKFPATKKINMALNPRSTIPSATETKLAVSNREPLAQGKLDTRPQTGQTKNSQPSLQQSTTKSNISTTSQQQQQHQQHQQQQHQRATSATSTNRPTQNSAKSVGGTRGSSNSGGVTSETNSTSNAVQGKPPTGPVQNSGTSRSSRDSGVESSQGSRMVLEVQKPKGPTKEEVREAIGVPDILDRGGDLSKLQARHAFATYLLRVQERLLAETCKPAEKLDEIDQHDEQMDLVLRFLKRAASNLQQPFKVIVPSRKLPIHDRRRILAKQLVDFVQIYSKETNQMDTRQPKRISRPHNHHQCGEDEDNIDDTRFDKFVNVASENELEELLTTYTKQNKSASIFLGTSTPQPKSLNDMMSQPTSVNQHKQSSSISPAVSTPNLASSSGAGGGGLLHRRTSSSESLHRGGGGGGDSKGEISTSGDGPHHHATASSSSSSSHPKRPHSTTGQGEAARYVSSADGAVQVYSAKFSRQRPYSAKPSHGFDSGDGRYASGRPTSAVVYRDSSGGQIAARHFSESSQQAIQEALQRLAKRQAARQYSASSTQNQNTLTQKYVEQHFGLVNPLSGPVQAGTIAGHGTNPVLTSSLSRSGSRSRSSSVGNVRMQQWDGTKSNPSTTAAATDTHAGGVGVSQSGSNSRMSSAVSTDKVRNNRSNENIHVHRASRDAIPLNRTQSVTTESSSVDSSDVSGPTTTTKTVRNQHASTNGGWSDDAYTAQLKALQQLTISNRAAASGAQSQNASQPMQEMRGGPPTGGSRPAAGVSTRPLSLQEQQQMAYELSQQSKAKHQEKIAQAHTNASALRDAIRRNAGAAASNSTTSSSSPSHRPRPPSQSSNARKPISTQRLARTAQFDDAPKNNTNFYTSLKYNNMTGLSQSNQQLYNSGTVQAQVIRH